MKRIESLLLVVFSVVSSAVYSQSANEILQKVDDNMSAENRIVESTMTVHGKRNSRVMTSVTYSVGVEKSFTEYLSPARDKGTKMLKLDDQLWIYSPSTDRTIQISGHLLKQSIMGSDFSYEDAMDDRKLTEVYSAKITGKEEIEGRTVHVLELLAIVDDVAYYKMKVWVDTERFVPLKQEMYSKSDQLLKRITLSDIQQVEGRWFPMKMVYKDMMKQGRGTEMEVTSIKFNQEIDEYIFTKAALKR